MVWILYPDDFVAGAKVPQKKEWYQHQTSKEEYSTLLAAMIFKESRRTPGESIVISCVSILSRFFSTLLSTSQHVAAVSLLGRQGKLFARAGWRLRSRNWSTNQTPCRPKHSGQGSRVNNKTTVKS